MADRQQYRSDKPSKSWLEDAGSIRGVTGFAPPAGIADFMDPPRTASVRWVVFKVIAAPPKWSRWRAMA